MILCGQTMAGVVGSDEDYLEQLGQLPALGRDLIQPAHEVGRASRKRRTSQVRFRGQRPAARLAREAQLKVKEMVRAPSDSYRSLTSATDRNPT